MKQSLKALLLLPSLLISNEITIGDTFKIAEKDFEKEIKRYITENKESINNNLKKWQSKAKDKLQNYELKAPADLPTCSKNKITFNNMEWVNNIPNKRYPVGTKVYPLKSITLPYSVYIINPNNQKEVDWLLTQDYKKVSKRVWVTGGKYRKLEEKLQVPIFHYAKNIHTRLKITCTPAYFYQEKDKFKIINIKVD